MLVVALCKQCSCTRIKLFLKCGNKVNTLYLSRVLYSNYTDSLVENLALEEGIKHESNLERYFKNVHTQNLVLETLSKIPLGTKNFSDSFHQCHIQDLVHGIEKEVNTRIVPNEKLKYLLVYFTKDGNINGVKAIQSIIEKHNTGHFKSHAEYNHYLAEAFWVVGKIHTSLQLFSSAYDNVIIRPKVKVMLPNLFPSLIAQYSEATLCKVIYDVESFSTQKRDDLILACLWKELFQSSWFSDQEQASKLLQKNNHLLKNIQWMVPNIGKNLLSSHRVDDFYRLIQFSLENDLKPMTDALIRLLFEYYYIHQNIERCTAVVKYSSNMNSPLTEGQQRRYVSLLLKSKDALCSKLIVKKPQDLKYKF